MTPNDARCKPYYLLLDIYCAATAVSLVHHVDLVSRVRACIHMNMILNVLYDRYIINSMNMLLALLPVLLILLLNAKQTENRDQIIYFSFYSIKQGPKLILLSKTEQYYIIL